MTDTTTLSLDLPERLHLPATRVYCAALHAKLTPFLGPVDRAARFLARGWQPDRGFVARQEDTILGIAGFRHAKRGLFDVGLRDFWAEYGLSGPLRGIALAVTERPERRDTLCLDGLAVAKAARGQGIGTRLLAAVCDHAKALGKSFVRLDVIDTNPRARALYEREGFRATKTMGVGPYRLILPFRSTTIMTKPV